MDEAQADTDSVSEESTDSEAPSPKPEAIEVKITNNPVKDVKWDDERDDIEYDEIILTKEEMDI